MEPRARFAQQADSAPGRSSPSVPLERSDPDAGRSSRFAGSRKQRRRKGSVVGGALLGLCALTVLGGLATAALVLRTYVVRDARFRITGADNIDLSGLTEVSRAQMLTVFGEDIGRNIFFVPLGERRRQLESIPWVERATVMRLLPNQIRVQVVERQPVAFVRQGHEIGLVDANGVLLTMSAATMEQHHYSFPVLTGIDAGDPLASRKARMDVYDRLLAELDSNGQHLSEQISEIDLSNPEDARILMPEQGADILAHFGRDRFLERYQRYRAHIAEWRNQFPKLATVDLRYDRQVVLEMIHGASAVEAAPGDQAASGGGGGEPGLGKAAEKGQFAGESSGELASGAKAPVVSAGSDAKAKALAQPSRPLAEANPGKATTEPVGNLPSGAKTAGTKTGTGKDKAANARKRAEGQRAGLDASKRKPVAMDHASVFAPGGE